MEYVLLEEVSSTQDYVKNKLLCGEYNNVVVAQRQGHGRGRRDRTWNSPNGGLWFSFDTEFTNELITLAVGVAACQACDEMYNCKTLLKWPNDLILHYKKVAGILCEKIGDRVVVGIGINTNVEDVNVNNSISFLSEANKSIDNILLMEHIVNNYKKIGNNSELIIKNFRENMAYVGKEKYVSALEKNVKIIGITDEGHLIVEENGIRENVFIGEIYY